MMSHAVIRNALILGVFAIVTAATLALTNQFTQKRVACNRQHALIDSLAQVMPGNLHDNVLIGDAIQVKAPQLGPDSQRIYRARRQDQPTGAILETTAPDGYGGAIDLIVGIDFEGRILGIRVVPPHNETPGLGDKIERRKSDWITTFNGHTLTDPDTGGWAVTKDGGAFDSFTGATITPRAVVDAVHRALLYFHDHRSQLFQQPSTAGSSDHTEGDRCRD